MFNHKLGIWKFASILGFVDWRGRVQHIRTYPTLWWQSMIKSQSFLRLILASMLACLQAFKVSPQISDCF